ncbi:MAG TPA: hypothetical protein VES88_10080 [Gemmatimonadaceae bacterium]|nr:hypothetical protein [Gemmatimonadaceae bacterium]
MTEPTSDNERAKEAATVKAEADAAKAKADARTAEAAARKAEQELADHASPEARRQREAEANQKADEAEKDAAAARRARLAALIPDVATVKGSTLEVKEGPQLWSTFLLGRALGDCAKQVADKLKEPLGGSSRILVTNESDLASADAVYRDVKTGLKDLVSAADKLLGVVKEESVEIAGATPVDALGALVSAVPAVLSLFSAHRTVSTTAVTASDLAASAAIAGMLKSEVSGATILLDDFRLATNGDIYKFAAEASGKRQQLIARKIRLSDERRELEAKLAATKLEVERLEKPAEPGNSGKLEDAQKEVYSVKASLADRDLRAGLIDSVVAAIDAFTTAIRAVPSGGHRSPLASAALQEELHGDAPRFTHVLLVKTQPGVAQQMIENRPLWRGDKFSTIVDASITYILIQTSDSRVCAASTETSIWSARGKIGGPPKIAPVKA